jgi:hypothetical protein
MPDHLITRVAPAYANTKANIPIVFSDLVPSGVSANSFSLVPMALFGYNIYNPNTSNVYIKFWDQINPTIGVDFPIFTNHVPPDSSIVLLGTDLFYYFSTRMYFAVTAGYAPLDNTAVVSPVLCQFWYL